MEDAEVPGLRGGLGLGSVWLTLLAFLLGLAAATAGSVERMLISGVLCGVMSVASAGFFLLALSPELSEAEDFLAAALAYRRYRIRGSGPGRWQGEAGQQEAARAA